MPRPLYIFHDPPRREGDDRQAAFGAALTQIFEDTAREGGEIEGVANLTGFRASAVDLGWLQDRILDYWFNEQPPYEQFRPLLYQELLRVVQRPKQLFIEPEEMGEDVTHIKIRLRTKDDHGWYAYEFAIYIKRDTRDRQDRLRAVE